MLGRMHQWHLSVLPTMKHISLSLETDNAAVEQPRQAKNAMLKPTAQCTRARDRKDSTNVQRARTG